MNPLPPTSGDRQTASQVHMNGLFLEKPGLLKEALIREEEWKKKVPGYDITMGRTKAPMTPLESSLYKLNAERELGAWAGQFADPRKALEDDGSDGNQGKPIQLVEDDLWDLALKKDSEDAASFDSDDEDVVVPSIITNANASPCVTAYPTNAIVPGIGGVPVRKEPVIVIIRHGKTEHNKLGLFTGWEDAPLAPEGVKEAAEAGRLLKLHGFEFDVVYTSWLGRAIETAWYCLNELDSLWLPIVKSWRLNERMYGSLTSLSKNMVKQRHGEDQFKAWRRGYKVRPPPVSSFSQHYPGNDDRYRKYMSDVRYSVSETLIRSIESGRVSLQRKIPKTESLKDCMDRTIPYFTEQIYPQAAEQGKRVLISSSENAIRGLLMHLCDIPEDRVTELEIPNGLPLIFDIKSKCVKLLDDGTGRDPLEVHNFGKAAKYLFRPCQNEDGTPDEECDIRYMGALYSGEKVEISDEDQATLDSITRRNSSITTPVSM
jgi:2,3-bisphosphoglycerate-dependent phosphoglycerate mutase